MSKTFFRGDEKSCTGASLPVVAGLSRNGQLIWLGSYFEKATYSLNQFSVQVSLNTNGYCGKLRIFQVWNWMLPRATENTVAGHMWPADGYLPTSGL